jgi:uncharacterized membrane protein YgdD (TMEM256/DUF423 family)
VQTLALRISAVTGLLAVGLGAFGAHGLKETLARHDTAAIWQTATLYHLVHAVAMLALAMAGRWRPGPWVCFLVGIVVFSGSLYVLGVTGVRWLGAVTPIGGASMMVGWLWIAVKGREETGV